MNNTHTIIFVAKVKEGSVNDSIHNYLQRGYIIHSATKYTSFEDGTMAIRFELKHREPASPLSWSRTLFV